MPTTSTDQSDSAPSGDVIRIMCPNLACKRVLAVPSHARGKLVRCRSCGINIRIPHLKVPEAPSAAGAPAEAKAKPAESSAKPA